MRVSKPFSSESTHRFSALPTAQLPSDDKFRVRPFERADRDQLTELINRHIQAAVPALSLSVNSVLRLLEDEPGEVVVDPWVETRDCFVVEDKTSARLAGAVLLRRFGSFEPVPGGYRGVTDIRFLVFDPAQPVGELLITTATSYAQVHRSPSLLVDSFIGGLGTHGISSAWPHVVSTLQAHSDGPDRTEEVLVVSVDSLRQNCRELTQISLSGSDVSSGSTTLRTERAVGALGTVLRVFDADKELGWVEVCTEHPRGRWDGSNGWADIGNFVVGSLADSGVSSGSDTPLTRDAAIQDAGLS